MIQAGELRHRVGFYRRLAVDDGQGNKQGKFPAAPQVIVRAAIRARLGGESILAGRLVGQNFVNVTIRQSADTAAIGTDWKARDEVKGVDYAIKSIVDPDQHTAAHGRFFEILCEQGATP